MTNHTIDFCRKLKYKRNSESNKNLPEEYPAYSKTVKFKEPSSIMMLNQETAAPFWTKDTSKFDSFNSHQEGRIMMMSWSRELQPQTFFSDDSSVSSSEEDSGDFVLNEIIDVSPSRLISIDNDTINLSDEEGEIDTMVSKPINQVNLLTSKKDAKEASTQTGVIQCPKRLHFLMEEIPKGHINSMFLCL